MSVEAWEALRLLIVAAAMLALLIWAQQNPILPRVLARRAAVNENQEGLPGPMAATFAQLKADIDELRSENERLKTAFDSVLADNSRLRRAMTDMERRYAELEQRVKIAEIEASDWRAAAKGGRS